MSVCVLDGPLFGPLLGLRGCFFSFGFCLGLAPLDHRLDVDIMPEHIKPQMTEKAVRALGRAPCFANETIDVGAVHGCRVIEGEHGVMSPFFELALTGNTGAATAFTDVHGVRENLFDHLGIASMHVASQR